MNKILILISLLCVFAIRGENSSEDGKDDEKADLPPEANHLAYNGLTASGGYVTNAGYRGNRRPRGSGLNNILVWYVLLKIIRDRKKDDTAASTAAATTAAPATTPALLSGYTRCPNGCQYKIVEAPTATPAVARAACTADGAVLGHQMLRTGVQRRAVFETCLGRAGGLDVMMYLEDPSGGTDDTDAATWGPDFEAYVDDGSAVTYIPPATAGLFTGFAESTSGFAAISFVPSATDGPYICEYCP